MNLRTILGFALGPIVGGLLSLATLPMLSWHFSSSDIGRFNIYQVLVGFSLVAILFGLDQAYIREFHDTPDQKKLLKSCIEPSLYALVVLVVLAVFFASSLSIIFYDKERSIYIYLSALSIALTVISRYFSLILRMSERGFAFSISQILAKFLLLAVIAILIFLDIGHDFLHLMIASLVSLGASAVMSAWWSKKQWIGLWNEDISRRDQVKYVQYGMPLVGAGFAYWGLTAINTIALRFTADLNALGVYAMAMNFAGLGTLLQMIFATIWAPVIYRWTAEHRNLQYVDKLINYVCIAVALAWVGTGLFSWIIELVLPSEYRDVKYLLACCMLPPLFYLLSEATVTGVNVARKTSYALWAVLVALLVNLIFAAWLIPSYGVVGAAISSAVTYFLFFVLRTEAAGVAWRPVQGRFRMYVVGAAMLIASVVYAVHGQQLSAKADVIFWIAVLVIILLKFGRTLFEFPGFLRQLTVSEVLQESKNRSA
ncbi:oligosaccharide flippase family protein [Xenophilus arseniciresistens]|uniref:Oligosaccharide flippase family protein n=1 Tax=Xenophilus arseniciresistens TaxID=1283306 RepID=A0AAE3SYH1_9BURK|nr:oligosaccharide flippase family protein [Xenophilus arseniciresistens]MDA7415490.1 oligosaccharide flippase family protein [Xenophilus arseniciresistens]